MILGGNCYHQPVTFLFHYELLLEISSILFWVPRLKQMREHGGLLGHFVFLTDEEDMEFGEFLGEKWMIKRFWIISYDKSVIQINIDKPTYSAWMVIF